MDKKQPVLIQNIITCLYSKIQLFTKTISQTYNYTTTQLSFTTRKALLKRIFYKPYIFPTGSGGFLLSRRSHSVDTDRAADGQPLCEVGILRHASWQPHMARQGKMGWWVTMNFISIITSSKLREPTYPAMVVKNSPQDFWSVHSAQLVQHNK